MRLDHLLSKEKETCTLVLFSFERSCGALAQLGERLLCTQEVSGSIPLGSINTVRVLRLNIENWISISNSNKKINRNAVNI